MNTAATALTTLAQGMQEYVLQVRHDLHAHPETRWETNWTRNYIIQQLSNMGFKPANVDSGIVVDIITDLKTKTIFCRADFDALTVQEQTGLPFASRVEGKSHACGHDVNVAMLLGALKAISEGKVKPNCNIRAYFDDAEENPGSDPRPESGSEVAVRDGITNRISRAYALHIRSHPENAMPGTFRYADMGNSGRIYFEIESSGGHVAMPNTGTSAIDVFVDIATHLKTFVSRRFNPTDPATLKFAFVSSGDSQKTNTMPASAKVWVGFRTLLPRDQHIAITQTVIDEVKSVAQGMGATITNIKLVYGHPALFNNGELIADVGRTLSKSGYKLNKMPPLLGGESFAYIANKVPSAMFMLDAYTKGSGDHHSPTFNPDESVFWKGVLFWLLLATN